MDNDCNIDPKDEDIELFHGFTDEEIYSIDDRTQHIDINNSDSDEDIEISYALVSGCDNNKDEGDNSNGAKPKTVTQCQVTRPPQLAANIRRTKFKWKHN